MTSQKYSIEQRRMLKQAAMKLTELLPRDEGQALLVLAYARQIVRGYLYNDEDPRECEIIALRASARDQTPA